MLDKKAVTPVQNNINGLIARTMTREDLHHGEDHGKLCHGNVREIVWRSKGSINEEPLEFERETYNEEIRTRVVGREVYCKQIERMLVNSVEVDLESRASRVHIILARPNPSNDEEEVLHFYMVLKTSSY